MHAKVSIDQPEHENEQINMFFTVYSLHVKISNKHPEHKDAHNFMFYCSFVAC